MASKNVIPDDSYKRKKLGFPVPLREWMKEEDLYNEIKKKFESPTAEKFFKTKKILKLLDKQKNDSKALYKKVWTIYTFIVWYDEFFKEV